MNFRLFRHFCPLLLKLKYRTTCGLGGRPDPDGAKKHLNIKWVIWVQETLSNIPIREPKNEPPLGRAGPKSVRGWLALRCDAFVGAGLSQQGLSPAQAFSVNMPDSDSKSAGPVLEEA